MLEEPTESQPADVSPEHKRRADERLRLPYFVPVQFLVKPEFRCQRALLHDISHGGLSLILDEPVAPGTLLLVRLEDRWGDTAIAQLVAVAHATQQADGTWLVGCTNRRRLTEDEVRSALGEPETVEPQDQPDEP